VSFDFLDCIPFSFELWSLAGRLEDLARETDVVSFFVPARLGLLLGLREGDH
jgi:hypothetical protein